MVMISLLLAVSRGREGGREGGIGRREEGKREEQREEEGGTEGGIGRKNCTVQHKFCIL